MLGIAKLKVSILILDALRFVNAVVTVRDHRTYPSASAERAIVCIKARGERGESYCRIT